MGSGLEAITKGTYHANEWRVCRYRTLALESFTGRNAALLYTPFSLCSDVAAILSHDIEDSLHICSCVRLPGNILVHFLSLSQFDLSCKGNECFGCNCFFVRGWTLVSRKCVIGAHPGHWLRCEGTTVVLSPKEQSTLDYYHNHILH